MGIALLRECNFAREGIDQGSVDIDRLAAKSSFDVIDGPAAVEDLPLDAHEFPLRALLARRDGVLAALFTRQFSIRPLQPDEYILVVNPDRTRRFFTVEIFGNPAHDFGGVGNLR